MDAEHSRQAQRSHLIPIADSLSRLPYWFLLAVLLAVVFLWGIANSGDYRIIFDALRKGVWTTIYVSLVAYALAILLGLFLALMRVYRSRLTQEISSLLVEVIRGRRSSPEAVATVQSLTLRLGKIPIVVRDGSGFLVNRVLTFYLNEAIRLEPKLTLAYFHRGNTYYKKGELDQAVDLGPFELPFPALDLRGDLVEDVGGAVEPPGDAELPPGFLDGRLLELSVDALHDVVDSEVATVGVDPPAELGLDLGDQLFAHRLKLKIHAALQGLHVPAGNQCTIVAPDDAAQDVHGGVCAHQRVAALPVERAVRLRAGFRQRIIPFEDMEQVAPRVAGALHGVGHRADGQRAPVGGLAAPAGVEGRPVEHDGALAAVAGNEHRWKAADRRA